MIKITIPALKYFLKHGLEGVKDLPEKAVTELRIGLALNFTDKASFIQAMKSSGVPADKLGAIFDDQTHLSDQMAGLETARATGMASKVWQSSGSCPKCKGMAGEEVPINANFSNGQPVAHGGPGCQCSTNYKKEAMKIPEDRIFTRGMIAEMTPQEYSTNRTKILEQYSSGLIK